jgi:hypothetical protein
MQVSNTPTSMLDVLEVSNMTPSKLYVVLGKRPQGTDEATVTLWEGVLAAGATLHEQTPASNFEYVVEAGVPRSQGEKPLPPVKFMISARAGGDQAVVFTARNTTPLMIEAEVMQLDQLAGPT